VDQLLLLPKEYPVAENRILKTQLQRRLRLWIPSEAAVRSVIDWAARL
jgi:hypothetical protein